MKTIEIMLFLKKYSREEYIVRKSEIISKLNKFILDFKFLRTKALLERLKAYFLVNQKIKEKDYSLTKDITQTRYYLSAHHGLIQDFSYFIKRDLVFFTSFMEEQIEKDQEFRDNLNKEKIIICDWHSQNETEELTFLSFLQNHYFSTNKEDLLSDEVAFETTVGIYSNCYRNILKKDEIIKLLEYISKYLMKK